jgi:hypothetical protein
MFLMLEKDVCIDPFYASGPNPLPHVVTFPGKTKQEIRELIPDLAMLRAWEGKSGITLYLHPSHFFDEEFRNELKGALPNCSVENSDGAGTLVSDTYRLQ